MSFPSAIKNLKSGMSPEDALFEALQTDTPLGFRYVTALVDVRRERPDDVVGFMRDRLPECADSVLRSEWIPAGGIKVDLDPDSVVGRQVTRLLGTDAARKLLEQRLESSFALANCCGGIGGGDKKETEFTIQQQIEWQNSIDC